MHRVYNTYKYIVSIYNYIILIYTYNCIIWIYAMLCYAMLQCIRWRPTARLSSHYCYHTIIIAWYDMMYHIKIPVRLLIITQYIAMIAWNAMMRCDTMCCVILSRPCASARTGWADRTSLYYYYFALYNIFLHFKTYFLCKCERTGRIRARARICVRAHAQRGLRWYVIMSSRIILAHAQCLHNYMQAHIMLIRSSKFYTKKI